MRIALFGCQACLLLWFFGCIVTYKIGSCTLVDGMGVFSPEAGMFAAYGVALLLFYLWRPVGWWVLLILLCLWLVIQFFCHWYYTLFGATEKKLRGYNACFQNTLRFWPQSEKRIVPDFYHIVLHLLLLANIILLILSF